MTSILSPGRITNTSTMKAYASFLVLMFAAKCILGQTGNLTVNVSNVAGGNSSLPGIAGQVVLYSSTWTPLSTKNLSSSNSVTFLSQSYGTYNYEVYHAPSSSSSLFGSEFWGGANVSINSSSQTSSFTRNMPYGLSMQVYANGQNVTGGSVTLGTQIEVRVVIKNPINYSQNCKARIVLDRSKTASYDFDLETSSSTVTSNSTSTFTKTMTPTTAGDYYGCFGTKTYVNTSYQITDGWGWISGKLITIIEPKCNLTVNVSNVSGGSSSIPGSNGTVDLYNSSGSLVSSQSTSSSNAASFPNLAYGTYSYKVYHDPPSSSSIFGEEYWGEKSNVSLATTSVSSPFTRYLPYCSSLKVFHNGQEITYGSIPAGTPIEIRIVLTNPSAT